MPYEGSSLCYSKCGGKFADLFQSFHKGWIPLCLNKIIIDLHFNERMCQDT